MRFFTETLVADRLTPVAAYAALRSAGGGASFLLESVVAGERWGRYSILGYRPTRDVVVAADDRDPFATLAREIPCDRDASGTIAERFAGAHVGYLGYDAALGGAKLAPSPGDLPLARFVGGATVVVFDNLRHTMTIASSEPAGVARAKSDLAREVATTPLAVPDPGARPDDVAVSMSDAEYEARTARAQEYIRAGDAFQIVLARTFSTKREGVDPFDAYRALRLLSPSPYMYFVDFPATRGAPAMQIAGASPETLVRLEDGTATLRPIAGTRRRGRGELEDRDLEIELAADPKEMAEHVMLIDLARNDVGRIAETGSVKVPVRAQIERFSHVMHIVSEVIGRVRDDVGAWDVVRSAFPAGTLSGAPKVRAMQIIHELEGRPRGVYGGAIGWIGPSKALDLAIAIRTIVCRDDRFDVTAGAGIVEASVPSSEAAETRHKSNAALAAVRAARGH